MEEWLRSVNEASLPFLVWIQGFQTDGLTSFMTLMSWLGREYFYILFFPLLYWCVNKRWAFHTIIALMVATYVGEFIKWTFKLPRPPSPPVQILWEETSPGFVSTHASTAVAVWGTLAILVRKWWFTLLVLFLIAAISFSRWYLGVHFPSDVIGGWLIGILAIWIALWLTPRIEPTIRSWPVIFQIIASIVLVTAMIAIYPSNWDGNRPAESAFRDGGLVFGMLLGFIWDANRLHFQVEGSILQRLLRYILGVFLLLILFFGLDFLFDAIAPDDYLLEQLLRFVRYGAVGFAVAGLAPWLFRKVKLSQ